MRWAASRTFWTAGSKRPMRMAMMAITTSSSTSVNAGRDGEAERSKSMLTLSNGSVSSVDHTTNPQVGDVGEPWNPEGWNAAAVRGGDRFGAVLEFGTERPEVPLGIHLGQRLGPAVRGRGCA